MKRPFAIPFIAACAIAGIIASGCATAPAADPQASSSSAQESTGAVLSESSLDAAADFSLTLLRTTMAEDGAGAAPSDDAGANANAASEGSANHGESEAAATAEAENDAGPAQATTGTESNRLISPFSVASALGMTANGAQGQTREQMEAVLGMSVDELNAFTASYTSTLPSTDEARVNIANSLWVNDQIPVKSDFLEENATHYGAGVFTTPFDKATKDRINGWVADNTDDMIESIVDSVSPDMALYLVNAMAFDAKWMSPYEETQVSPGTFTTADGKTQDASMMGSAEHAYLTDGNAVGFAKPYADGAYAFAALLPNEGVSLEDYVAGLDGTGFRAMMANAQSAEVEAYLPKFEVEQSLELADVLGRMGMADAFDAGVADFSGMSDEAGERALHIDRVTHKTFISVAEQGTRAGAATSVSMRVTAAMPDEEPKIVRLDRPFVYAIVDTQTNLPLFLGTVESLS